MKEDKVHLLNLPETTGMEGDFFMKKEQIRQLTALAMLTALAYLVMVVCRLPLVPEMGFLKYDPKDIILVICGFLFGPLPCLAVTACVTLLEMLTVSSSGLIGFVMNILASLAFSLPAAFLYQKKRNIQSALVGLVLGVILMTGIMLLWNDLLTPLYTGWPRDKVVALLIPAILPFNLIKGGLNLSLTLLLYQPLNRALRAANLLPVHSNENGRTKTSAKALYTYIGITAAFLFVTLVLIVLRWKQIL